LTNRHISLLYNTCHWAHGTSHRREHESSTFYHRSRLVLFPGSLVLLPVIEIINKIIQNKTSCTLFNGVIIKCMVHEKKKTGYQIQTDNGRRHRLQVARCRFGISVYTARV